MRVSAVFVALLLAACTPQAQPVTPSMEVSSTAAVSSSFTLSDPAMPVPLEGTEYRDEAHGFSVAVPAGSTVEAGEYGVRLQNYSWSDDRMGLAPGEYYLEISWDGEGQLPCAETVEQGTRVTVGEMAGYRGLGLSGGDAGGQRYALCLEGGGYFYVQATENSADGAIANAILDSFRPL